MNVRRSRHRTPVLLCTAVMFASGLAAAPGAAAAPAPAKAPATTPEAPCTVRDGYPPGARNTGIGGSPMKYRFANSPYVGARYESCAGTLKLYYGGHTSPRWAYYEVQYTHPTGRDWKTWQVRIGERRVATWDDPERGSWNFKVRACAQSIDDAQGRNCTPWSPQLFVYTGTD